jgi:uncharacterized protein (TIGR02996 family)
MPTEDDLLAGIVAHPAELDRWHVLADWLEDQDDPRAELARLRFLLHTEPDHPERDERLARQWELLESGLEPVVPTWTSSIGIRFALILPGSFWMGSPESEPGRYDDEIRHRVTLTWPYLLGVYPLTVGEFERFVQATGYQTEAECGDGASGIVNGIWRKDRSIHWRAPGFKQSGRHPVGCVTWNDAQALLAWLNESAGTGQTYSLPTEAQWEYACRAGSETAYWWGNDAKPIGDFAWYDKNSEKKSHRVESKRPNPWGLHHMAGHVWEWSADWFGEYPRQAVSDPSRPASDGSGIVIRGGSWYVSTRECRVARRCRCDPDTRYTSYGLRLAIRLA